MVAADHTLAGRHVNLVNLISIRMHGHAGPSGYDRLADFLDAEVIYPISDWTIPRRLFFKILNLVPQRSASLWYHRNEFSAELRAARKWLKKKNQIFHFIYGENCHRYLGTLKSMSRRNFIVGTYHTPPDIFCEYVHNHKHLSRLDAIIVVSTMQADFFSDLVGFEKVFFVPHGIDVNYFKPRAEPRKNIDGVRILFVGSMLRDFETLAETAHLLNSQIHDFSLSIVTSPKFHHFFQGIDNIELYSGISDNKLLHLYQTSDILLLPLLGCTANNSLLEAMACGLPIVSTDLPGVRDYVNDDCALLTPKSNPKDLAERIHCLKENEVVRQKMALESRNRALDFSWPKIATKTMEVYHRIFK